MRSRQVLYVVRGNVGLNMLQLPRLCKQTVFRASLAQAAGAASEAVVIKKIVSISSRRHLLVEAIRVETSIMAPGETAAQELAGRLTADNINRDHSHSARGCQTLAYGGILGIVFLAGIVACFCRWKCKNHSMAPSHDSQIPAALEMGTLATSVNESLVCDDLEVSSAPCLVSSAPCLEKFPGARELREQVAHNAVQHAGPGQVQTNQAQDKEVQVTVPHIEYKELAVESNALAAGSFKAVYKARWKKKGRNVALLVLRHCNQAALSDLDNEIRIFGTLGKHKHLAELLATCTKAQSEDKCMVIEFAPLGSMDHVLSKTDEDGVDISNLVKITVGMQVADAMTHLHLYNVVHRDLAIRNTLAFRFDPVLVKVTDYGMSLLVNAGYTRGKGVVEIQTMSSDAVGPTRWMAPESIMRRVYSKKSDVWRFGVLLHEVWTRGMIPYHLIADDKEVARVVLQGERLSRLDNCPQKLHAIMQDWWKSAQKDRPSMPQLQTALQEAFTEESLEAAKTECVVCLSAEPVMALMPCGHRCACAYCAASLRICPICRCPVQEAKRSFG
jgi:hypothetical protein